MSNPAVIYEDNNIVVECEGGVKRTRSSGRLMDIAFPKKTVVERIKVNESIAFEVDICSLGG